jgi:hypothetical protein
MTFNMKMWWGVSLLWLLGWGIPIVGVLFGSQAQQAEAAYLSRPLTTALTPGAEARLEGRIAPGAAVKSPYSGEEGAAVMTNVWYVTSYDDIHGKVQFVYHDLALTRVGPDPLTIVVGEDTAVRIPLSRWTAGYQASRGTSSQHTELPAGITVDPEAHKKTIADAQHSFHAYEVRESVLASDALLFVAGQLESGTSEFILDVDPVTKRVEIYQGTQAELVAMLEGNQTGLWIMSVVFLVVAVSPILILVVVMAKGGQSKA